MIVLSGRISSVYNELAPMQVIPIALVVMIAFALIVVKLFNSLRSMQIQMGAGVIVSRDESPLLFWLVIVLQCLAVGVLLGIIYVACFILPNSVMS
jgi:hypothetical protein